MTKVVTFGEIMMRLSTQGHARIAQADSFRVGFGGAEANVAVNLAGLGVEAEFVTKLPDNELGNAALNDIRKFGVGVSHIVRGGDRLGVYYLESGASVRPSKVVYDRAGSSIATAVTSEFDWNTIFQGASWFHFSGITPALSESTLSILEQALIAARTAGMVVSCDLNYRSKLWTKRAACDTMSRLAPYIHVLIANEQDAADVFGISATGSDICGGKLDFAGYCEVANELYERFGFKCVAITQRESISASDNRWSALLYDCAMTKQFYRSKTYDLHIVDRVGGGDSFAAGLIYGLSNFGTNEMQRTLDFAVAASALKHTIEGDYNAVSLQEIEALVGGNASGRVVR